MCRFIINKWTYHPALIAGLLMTVVLSSVASAVEPPQPAPPADVLITHPVAVTRPLVMMLAAPGAENAPGPNAAAEGGAFNIAVEAPANGAAPPPPPAIGGVIRAPIVQRFVPAGAMQVVTPAGVMETGKFWFGMMCTPAPEVLRSQIALPAGTGLVVQEIVPEGPAAKSGVQRFDVLLQADGKPLPDAAALGKVANDKGVVAIDFNLLRGGKPQTLKVTPAERPAQAFNVFIPQGDDRQAVDQWIEHLRQMAADRPAAVPGRPLRLRILRPAHVAGADPQAPFPADLNVKVTREGNGPTKIEVRQGEKSWQITSDEIAKLPETIRPFVQGMAGNLGGGRPVGAVGSVEAFPVPEVEIPAGAVQPVPGGPPQFTPAIPPANVTAPLPPQPFSPAAAPPKDRGTDINQLRDQVKELQRRLDQLDEGKSAK